METSSSNSSKLPPKGRFVVRRGHPARSGLFDWGVRDTLLGRWAREPVMALEDAEVAADRLHHVDWPSYQPFYE